MNSTSDTLDGTSNRTGSDKGSIGRGLDTLLQNGNFVG